MPKLFAYVFVESTEPREIYASFLIPPPEDDHGKLCKNLILVGIKLPKFGKLCRRTLLRDRNV